MNTNALFGIVALLYAGMLFFVTFKKPKQIWSIKKIRGFGQMDFGQIGVGSAFWQELPENNDFILSIYELIGKESRMPENKNEMLLVVDEYNRINKEFFEKVGVIDDIESYKITNFIGENILKVFSNNDF